MMVQRLRLAALLTGLWLATALPAAAAPPSFADWAAVVVAGDFRAHSGKPSEVFDNARHDVSQALTRIGFAPANVRQFSVRPSRYVEDRPGRSDIDDIYDGLIDVAARATGGCLIYFSSHGAPEGVLVGRELVAPGVVAFMIDHTCGQRPTVVVISACFSGVFVPALAGPNRMVLTAARPDRSSFGCGEADRYPFFDDCFLSSMRGARDFLGLGRAVQACVAAREKQERASPPSEPQLSIGGAIRPLISQYAFPAPVALN